MRQVEGLYKCDADESSEVYLREYYQLSGRTDRLIAVIMGVQWLGAIAASMLISKATVGSFSANHPYVLAAVMLGGLLTLYPIYLACVSPGHRTTRHLIAACQMLMSGLLIHITGGRIETHFHVFGSLALLSLYLDWQVLATATVATFIDHAFMGYYMPACLFGTSTLSHWRIVEHVLWVIVFDIFLIIACVQSQRRLRVVAKREADQVYVAHHDALTGLGNRLLLDRLMVSAVDAGLSYSYMALDLDKFKAVNDILGHHIGDEVLILAAKRMAAEIGGAGQLIRMGGDEFALMLPKSSGSAIAEEIANNIILALNQPFQCNGHSIHIGVSIGICHNDYASIPNDEVFHNSDLALYKVKNSGRNRYVVFDGSLEAETLHNMSLESRLRDAIFTEALYLHYQPIVNTRGVLLSFEALLRWSDAIHGSVSPAEFIPVAEKSGLIVPLGRWVLRQACAQGAEWYRAGNRPVKMSVNVSATQLVSESFLNTVMSALNDFGLPPEMLDLELTESTLIEDHYETLKQLQALNRLGVRLSIDDFGTGYSSLSYLRDLPVHTVKIDRAFVKDIASREESRLLIAGMISMAHTLKLRVVAEGVENREQLNVLVQAGCDEIQGFHISRAISSEEAQKFMHLADSGLGDRTPQSNVHEMPLRLTILK